METQVRNTEIGNKVRTIKKKKLTKAQGESTAIIINKKNINCMHYTYPNLTI